MRSRWAIAGDVPSDRPTGSPAVPLAGRLAAQSLLFALGEGTFMTGSAVFFTTIVELSAAQVGLGLTCAASSRSTSVRAATSDTTRLT